MKTDSLIRTILVLIGAVSEMAAAVLFAFSNMSDPAISQGIAYLDRTHEIDRVIAAGELLLMLLVFSQAVRFRKYYVMILSALGTLPILYMDFFGGAESTAMHIRIDELTVIMVLIVGIVGSLICIYATGYIKDYHIHHTEVKDRSGYFLAMLFVFLGAMMGLVTSDNLSWMYFFWEITSVCSFLLIGYSGTGEAVTNSFRALWMNLLGGLGFMIAILFCSTILRVSCISELQYFSTYPIMVMLPVSLLSFAALTKSAQMPFSSWLLGAMVAPTPTSALLHSATMVKAGVYLLIRLSPLMRASYAGIMVTAVGGFTFFAASLLAIGASDGKRVLAYSTVSNLGLITAAAGCGTHEAVWAGIMLLIFHAVTKSMMFMSVGVFENTTHSRDIEDMQGMIVRFPRLAFIMITGIFGMSLVPLGMCVAKWAALRAFVDSGYVYLTMFLCFGSASTLFYWIKWLGKIFMVPKGCIKEDDKVGLTGWVAMYPLSVTVIVLCTLYPMVSRFMVAPLLSVMFGVSDITLIGNSDFIIMGIMVVCICLLPLIMRMVNRPDDRQVSSYMSGFNTGDDMSFFDSTGDRKEQELSNWYMSDLFGEKKIFKPCVILSASFVIIMITLCTIGGLLI